MKACALCKGTGFTIKLDPATKEETAYPCDCFMDRAKKDYLERKLISSYIPIKYRDYTIESYLSMKFDGTLAEAHEPQIAELKKILNNTKEFTDKYDALWIWGRAANAGHTSLAVALCKKFLENGYKVRYIRMQDLLDAFTNFKEKSDYFHSLEQYNVYFIDDAFDTTRCIVTGDYTNIHLYNWISSALSDKKYFICTSKVPVSRIDKVFEQSKNLFLRSCLSLEFQGSFSKFTSAEQMGKL